MPSDSLHFPPLRRRAKYSSKSHYSGYRQEIREDCLGRCVYCDAHENEIGGDANMSLDHFRPKSYPEFSDLIHDPHNLTWACRRCNELKHNHWPALGTTETISGNEGFVDPFAEDRRDYFRVLSTGELRPLKPPAPYLISLLLLNRFAVRRIRKQRALSAERQASLADYLEAQTTRINRLLEEEGRSDAERAQLIRDRTVLKEIIGQAVEYLAVALDFDLHQQ